MTTRRAFLGLATALGAACSDWGARSFAEMAEAKITLLTAPVEIVGPWGDSLPQAARQVVLWMRAACLAGVELKSDRQPERLRIEDHTSGPPAIWLHAQPPTTAWVIVDIGTRDWCKLAYQFGHELGHVFANSWNAAAWPRPPCQWLEESLVEAFSIRGLGHLADEWARDPPFYGDAAFSGAIRQYRSDLIERYRKAGGGIEGAALAGWLRAGRADLETNGGVRDFLGPAILTLVADYEADTGCVEDLGALNRWPERTGLPLEGYLTKWTESCAEIGAPGRLPARLKQAFGLN